MFKILKRMGRRERLMALLCVILVLGQVYFDLKLPDYMSQLTRMIKVPGSSVGDIWMEGFKMLGVALASAVLTIAAGFLAANAAAGFSHVLRRDVFYKVSDLSQGELSSFSVASLVTRSTNDVTQVQMLIAIGLQILVKAPVTAVWAVIKILDKNLTFSLYTAAYVLILLCLMAFIIFVVIPRVKRVQKLTDRLNLSARENLSGLQVVHAYNAEDYQNRKFSEISEEMRKTQIFNQRSFALLMPSVSLVMNSLSLTIFWAGAGIIAAIPQLEIMRRITTFSDVMVFSSYASFVIMSIMMMVMIIMFAPAAQVSANRIAEVLDKNNEIVEGATRTATERGSLEFKNVSFRYPDSSDYELEEISFRVEPGQTVAIIGSTGSGKSTLVNLIPRFYDVTEGQVLLDGVDLRDFSFEALYNRIGFITQNAQIFSGTIRDNVLFGRSGSPKTEADLERALNLSCAADFVAELPEGTDAPVARGGANFSGGQKQRLSIARALAGKPELLVFDDSFSALDYKTDRRLRQALVDNLNDVTRLIVAQRISTIRNADSILVLDRGRIVGQGKHEELMKHCEVYREIALSQLSQAELGA